MLRGCKWRKAGSLFRAVDQPGIQQTAAEHQPVLPENRLLRLRKKRKIGVKVVGYYETLVFDFLVSCLIRCLSPIALSQDITIFQAHLALQPHTKIIINYETPGYESQLTQFNLNQSTASPSKRKQVNRGLQSRNTCRLYSALWARQRLPLFPTGPFLHEKPLSPCRLKRTISAM